MYHTLYSYVNKKYLSISLHKIIFKNYCTNVLFFAAINILMHNYHEINVTGKTQRYRCLMLRVETVFFGGGAAGGRGCLLRMERWRLITEINEEVLSILQNSRFYIRFSLRFHVFPNIIFSFNKQREPLCKT